MAEEENITPQAFEALAKEAGLSLRTGSAAEMAAAYARLRELAQQVRTERSIDAEPAHVFKA